MASEDAPRLNDATPEEWSILGHFLTDEAKIEIPEEPVGSTLDSTSDLLRLHSELTEEAATIMEAKNHDYCGGHDSPFANFESSATYDVHPVVGIIIRIGDKLKRIETFTKTGRLKVADEGLRDACLDIINYIVLIYGYSKSDRNHLLERANG